MEQTKCYCGHTIMCDCGVLQNSIEWLYEQLTSTWHDKKSAEGIFQIAKGMYEDELKQKNMKDKTILSASANGVDVSISLSAFCTAHELMDAFESILSALTYHPKTVEEAFLDKSEQIRQRRLEDREKPIHLEDDCN